jgi:hypothetical protein
VELQRLATLNMILWKDLKRVRIRLPGFLAIEVQLRLWLEQRFAGAFELWRAHVLRQGPNTQLPYIGGELDLVCATRDSFGLGIDQQHVRLVLLVTGAGLHAA